MKVFASIAVLVIVASSGGCAKARVNVTRAQRNAVTVIAAVEVMSMKVGHTWSVGFTASTTSADPTGFDQALVIHNDDPTIVSVTALDWKLNLFTLKEADEIIMFKGLKEGRTRVTIWHPLNKKRKLELFVIIK